jgi:hypothetical protein
MKTVVEVLKPLAKLTTKLQAEKLSIPDLVGNWVYAMHQLEGMDVVQAKQLRELVKKRESSVLGNRLVILGTFLDLKTRRLLSEDDLREAKKNLILLHNKKEAQSGGPAQEQLPNTSPAPEDLSDFDSFFGSFHEPTDETSALSQSSALNDEIHLYEKLKWNPRMAQTTMEFWKSKVGELPLLSSLAMDIMAVPPTEVSVERLFSHLKIVLTDRRNRLSSNLVESILFLRLNKKFAAL